GPLYHHSRTNSCILFKVVIVTNNFRVLKKTSYHFFDQSDGLHQWTKVAFSPVYKLFFPLQLLEMKPYFVNSNVAAKILRIPLLLRKIVLGWMTGVKTIRSDVLPSIELFINFKQTLYI
ncbi:unnamed protein product, partial [Diabrotica balteata]